MPNGGEKRWSWYGQVRDIVFAASGLAILGVMAYRDSWTLLGVVAALACMGVLGVSALSQFLTGRRNGNGSPRPPTS